MAPKTVATLFGFLSAAGLMANASLSLYAVALAAGDIQITPPLASRLNAVIGLLAAVVIMLNGVWYLLTHWVARRSNQLPGALSLLGMAMGVLSLIPPLAILVLVLSVVWSAWIGQMLRKAGQGASDLRA